jgi:hypothetical protein
MRRSLVWRGAARPEDRPVKSVACLAFVAFLAMAFWAGALWIIQFLFRVSAAGY